MKEISSILATYEVVTPPMVGGANHAPEFRLQSYVNVVRWWWRFLALGRYGGDEDVAAFWDGVLFGWSSAPFGRKRVNFRLEFVEPRFRWNGPDIPGQLHQWSGINYLTAQGFRDDGTGGREPAQCGAFGVVARVPSHMDSVPFEEFAAHRVSGRQEAQAFLGARLDAAPGEFEIALATLVDAMAMIGLAGGIGARMRRGFGSLAIRQLQPYPESGSFPQADRRIDGLPEDMAAYEAALKRHLGIGAYAGDGRYVGDSPPSYTTFSNLSRFEICASGDDIATLMNQIGWAFQIYRSWGQEKGPKGPTKEHEHRLRQGEGSGKSLPAGRDKTGADGWYMPEFAADHDDFYANGRHGRKYGGNHTDNRSIFGLPHNYGGAQVGWSAGNPGENVGRRASPLMFHFHKLADGKAVFLCLSIPAKLVPEVESATGVDPAALLVKVGSNHSSRSFPSPTPWRLIKDFAGFVRGDIAGPARDDDSKGVAHTDYLPETISI